jgi:outer membrane protein TolC
VQTTNALKELDGVLYYNQSQYELKIPTWFGIDVHAGIESTTGNRLNPEETKGPSSYVGLSVPVVKNLLLDKRRAILKQAAIFKSMSEAEQRATINTLLNDASGAYWNWWEAYTVYQLFGAALDNAEKRLHMVRIAYQQGERPAIDTLEAITQLQAFQLRQSEIGIQLNQARLELSAYLWQKDAQSYELPQEVVPGILPSGLPPHPAAVDELLQATNGHPEVQQYRFKLKSLQLERRLKFQSLLPSVYLKYNQLGKGFDMTKTVSNPWLENNYRYGISINMPLRLSEGRGEYRKAQLKIEQARLAQSLKQVQLQNKVQQYFFQVQQLKQQVQLQQDALGLLQRLQRSEEQKFLNGESTLFLINSREAKALEAAQKEVQLKAKYMESLYTLQWAAGQLQTAHSSVILPDFFK